MLRKLALLTSTLALALSAAACGGPEGTAIETSTVKVTVPEGWIESTDEAAISEGWEIAYVDDGADPHRVIRVSEDLGLAPAADTSAGSLQARSMFSQSYGSGFRVVDKSDFTLARADRAIEVEFEFTLENGDTMTGYWWLFSDRSVGVTAGVELTGADISVDEAEAVRDSIRYTPGG
ncbi:hypothetical protein ACUXNS_000476 [Brevibacterium pityocampae]